MPYSTTGDKPRQKMGIPSSHITRTIMVRNQIISGAVCTADGGLAAGAITKEQGLSHKRCETAPCSFVRYQAL